jgi:hypothetical protein
MIKQEYYTAMSIKMWIKLFTWMREWTGITAFHTTGQKIVSDNIIVPIQVPTLLILNDYHNDSQIDRSNQIGNIRSEI